MSEPHPEPPRSYPNCEHEARGWRRCSHTDDADRAEDREMTAREVEW